MIEVGFGVDKVYAAFSGRPLGSLIIGSFISIKSTGVPVLICSSSHQFNSFILGAICLMLERTTLKGKPAAAGPFLFLPLLARSVPFPSFVLG